MNIPLWEKFCTSLFITKVQRLVMGVLTYLSRFIIPEFICFAAILVIVLSLQFLVIACWTSEGNETIYGSTTGVDYSTFYVAGSILNDYSPNRLYDLNLQSELYHKLLPNVDPQQELPFLNPPFFALMVRPFSSLPYIPAYLSWIAASIFFYGTGLMLLRRSLRAIPKRVMTVAVLSAVSFFPFIVEATIGGNSSAFGFFSVCLALYLERKRMPVWSGMALGLCLYKPTWLILLLPMLVVSRRIQTIMGFVATAFILFLISILSSWQASLDYVQLLFRVTDMSTSSEELFRTAKYVDLGSFFRLLIGNLGWINWTIILTIVAGAMYFLSKAWWNLDRYGSEYRDYVWACTLTWTTVFNLHFGIYDTVIVTAAMFLTADILYRQTSCGSTQLSAEFKLLTALLWISSVNTYFTAEILGFQFITLVLFATGAYQLHLSSKSTRIRAANISPKYNVLP